MDLSVLENKNLPKRVMAFLKEEFGPYGYELAVLEHKERPYLSNPLISEHRLYLQLHVDGESFRLVVVRWTLKGEDCRLPTLDEMFISDFQLFMKLIPTLSA